MSAVAVPPLVSAGIAPGITRVVPARVGLVGNPSDGYAGAVLATVVLGLAATVSAVSAHDLSFEGAGVAARWPSVPAWLEHVQHSGHGDEQRIISASLWSLVDQLRLQGVAIDGLSGLALGWETTVPRSVGLAGSSALAVAVIDAAAAAWGVTLDRRVAAALALMAERDVLGISAGWQDRIVQAYGRTVLVDAARMDEVDGLAVPAVATPNLPSGARLELLTAWVEGSAASSDDYHAPLQRHAANLATPMAELAVLARGAAAAVERGDVVSVAAAMDEAWLTRQACAPLRADHAALVELVRSSGMHATTPGSGGAVVAVCLDEDVTSRAIEVLRAAGCRFVRFELT